MYSGSLRIKSNTIKELQERMESDPDGAVFAMYMDIRPSFGSSKEVDHMLLGLTKEGVPFDVAVRYIVAARTEFEISRGIPECYKEFGRNRSWKELDSFHREKYRKLEEIYDGLCADLASDPRYYWDEAARNSIENLMDSIKGSMRALVYN